MLNKVCLAILVSLSLASPEASPEALASPSAYASDYGYYSDYAVPLPVAVAPSSQYHAQDDLGQYNYGFTSQDQTKSEIKTADGITRGAYSYVDANGIVQSVQYIADALGFRVAATNLPVHDVDTPVAQAAIPVVPSAQTAIPVYQAAMTPSVDYAYLPYAQDYTYHVAPTQYVQTAPAPSVHVAAPVIAAVQPVVPEVTGSQYHAQDEAGQYSFGYNDPNSVRQEVKTADGVVRGAYRYVDTDGVLQTVEYIADAGGFRVAASNLPQAIVQLPISVVDTPEVAAAKIAHAEAYAAQAYAAAPVHVQLPISVVDTPEVAAAKIAHAEAYATQAYAAAPVHMQLPISVVDTPEVVAAKIAHAEYYAQASAAAAVQPEDLSLYDTDVTFVQEPIEPVEYAPAPAPIQYVSDPAPTPIQYVAAPAPVPVQYVSAPAPVTVQYVSAPAPIVHISPVSAAEGSQFHAQDDLGQYNYGYSDGNSVKQEIKTADGVTRGGYSYIDANGIVQTVNYIADAMGFRVAATNLPVHNVDVSPAAVPSTAPLPVVPSAYTQHAITPQVNYAYLPYATNYAYDMSDYEVASPTVVAASTGVAIDGTNSQFHAQDDLGQYNYGFTHPTQTKQEVKTADGVTRGGYSYIDANGIVQTVNYISDAMGFRVAATNLPVHVVDGPVETAAAPVAVSAPAVAAVHAAHHSGQVISPQVQYSYLPYAQNYGYHEDISPAVQSVRAAPTRPVSSITPTYYGAAQAVRTPVHYSQQLVAAAPVVVPAVHAAPLPVSADEGSQYHAQDDLGQYSFGYSDGNSMKQEIKTVDGVVRGAYSYVDSDGLVQHVNYIADDLGFRVVATNLPIHNLDTPVEAVSVPVPAPVSAPVIAPEVAYAYLPYATNYGYSLPEAQAAPVVHSVPVVATAPVDATSSQFHAQDDLGQYNYGYSDGNSVKQEIKTADGVTRGGYSYIDANGIVQTVNYIADAMGFRVAATNLPVHNVESVVEPQMSYAQNYGYTAAAAA